MRINADHQTQWLILWLLGGLLLRSAIALFLPPGFDEAYYYLYTQHLDWSYFDHPLMVALSTGFGPWLTGTVSQFTIRLGTLLLHTAALGLLYCTSLRLFSASAARLTLAIATLIPIFLVGFGVLTLPDAPLIFFWTATVYVAADEFFGTRKVGGDTLAAPYRPTYRIALIGLLVGLACLSKYHGVALGVGLVGFCLTSPPHRRVFTSPWVVVSLLCFLLAIAPILGWNAQHEWVSVRFQSGRAVPDRGYSWLDLLVTFLAGVGYLFPAFGLPLWWVSGNGLWKYIRQRVLHLWDRKQGLRAAQTDFKYSASPTLLILWLALPLMVGFTLMGGYRAILPTWAMPGFWGATLLLGERAAVWQKRSPRTVQRWLQISAGAIVTFLLVALIHVNLGIFQKPGHHALWGGFLPPTSDATAQLTNIRQLKQALAQSPELSAALNQTDFLFTNDIFLAGRLSMAIASLSAKPMTCLDSDLRGFAFWSAAEQWVGQNGLLFVAETVDVDRYNPYFESIQKVGEIPIQRGGVTVQTIRVYSAQRLLKAYPRPYGN